MLRGTSQSLVRRSLVAARAYYVRTNGSDSNNGLENTAGGAFLTIQKAVDTVLNGVDLNGFDVSINVGAGTYTGAVTIARPFVGMGTVTIQGNYSTPSNIVISTTSADAFLVTNGAAVQIGGMKIRTTTSGNGISATTGGYAVSIQNEFGACADSHINAGSGTVLISGSYTISGGATSHWHVGGNQGLITVAGTPTITLTGTPAFSAYFGGVSQGRITCAGAVFSGSATGKKFLVHHLGIIHCLGQSLDYLPGDAAGEESDLGRFIGSLTYPLPWRPGFASDDQIGPLEITGAADTLMSNAANRIVLMPFLVPHRLSVDAMGVWVVTNGTSATSYLGRLGIYRSDGRGRPKTTGGLIIDAGTIDLTTGSTGAYRTVSMTATELYEGIYWAAFAWNIATGGSAAAATLRTVTLRGLPSSSVLAGGALPNNVYFNNTDYTGGLPTTLPALTANNSANVSPGIVLVVV